MFSTSLRAIFIALVAIATAVSVSATPGLSLKVTGPATVDGVENLKVVATLTNTGDETLKLLNDPNSILSTLPADTFFITNDSGDSPDFIGVRAKYSPAMAAASNNPRAATIVAPGTSVSFTHDLSSAYNFTSTGYSTYTIAPSTFFLIANANHEISELHTAVESFTTRVTNGKLAVARLPGVTKRATFNGCSATEQTKLNAAASAAQNYSQTALTYLRSHYASTTRYTTWFGLYTDSRHTTVLNHFGNISSHSFSGFKYDCTCTDPSLAYVYPDMFGTVYICSDFWTAPATGTDSQAGTLVHEASHFTANGGTTDGVGCDPDTGKNCVYGQAAVKALARSNPAQVILIADAHEYFAENTPALP